MDDFRLTPYQTLVLMLLSRILQRVSALPRRMSANATRYNLALISVADAGAYAREVKGNQRDAVYEQMAVHKELQPDDAAFLAALDQEG